MSPQAYARPVWHVVRLDSASAGTSGASLRCGDAENEDTAGGGPAGLGADGCADEGFPVDVSADDEAIASSSTADEVPALDAHPASDNPTSATATTSPLMACSITSPSFA